MTQETQISIVCPQCLTEYRVSPAVSGKTVACKRCGETFTAVDAASSPPQLPHLGLLAVKYNLITREQLSNALAALTGEASGQGPEFLESVLVERGYLTASQIENLKLTEMLGKVSQQSRRFGALAVEKSMVSQENLKAAFEKQAALFRESKTVRHVKDLLLEEGHLSEADHDAIFTEMEKPLPGKRPAAAPKRKNKRTSLTDVEEFYELIISEDRMSAELRAKTNRAPALTPTAIRGLLKIRGITHGIIEDAELETLLSSPKNLEAPAVIARGTPPQPGRDAEIHYHFTKDQKIGTLGAHGEIDFKDKGEVPFVRQGDLLAEKTPAAAGMPGRDIFGNEIAPPKPKDVKLLFGTGVSLSEDKLKLSAKAEGQPKLTLGSRLSVVSDLVVNGDVDLKSGHIDFEGDVKISGTIQSGFHVTGVNVEAKEIMGAQVTATGNVTATGGIIGAVVKAQGDIKAKYIKNASLSTFGDIIVVKEITDSNINTSGACRLDRGKILSSEISAKQGIEAVDIGTDVSSPCRLTMGVNDHIEAEVEGLQNAISRRKNRLSQMVEKITSLELQQQKIHKKIAELAQIQDRALVKQRSLKNKLEELADDDSEKRPAIENAIASLGQEAHEAEDALGNLFDRQDVLTQETEKLQKEAEQVRDDIYELKHELEAIRHWAKSQKKAAAIKVSGVVVQGTVIAGPHARAIIKETARNVTIREVKNTDPKATVEWEIKLQHS